MEDSPENEEVALETPISDVFIPPSINEPALLSGDSYTYFSPIPPTLLATHNDSSQNGNPAAATTITTTTPPAAGPPCVLGVDEAGRGPVLGPMVYGVFFLPTTLSDNGLLRSSAHRFDDSKALTASFRSSLVRALCAPGSDLHSSCGWAVSALSARDIGAGMLRPGGSAAYNLNAQALDATVDLIRGVYARGVNVAEIYVDTVGVPAAYQAKLERVFPTARITVAKKADSLYPCVSAASVCAKVTRDVALEVLYRARGAVDGDGEGDGEKGMAWGSGYPSDGKCVSWLKTNVHPVFGWGPECRFSWGTAKDMLEAKGSSNIRIEWPVDDDYGENTRMTDFFTANRDDDEDEADELGTWFGKPVGIESF
ncbi:ribonuclease H2 subunit A [Phialemonium atrogriseum]|uniref:Ribonuclease n=1 Tax=Phialemonium atrogriseum TaxID=1093897 RepID=A0AAJ0FLV8_9PEZI|nr:ribonuclease H2 subunit A [Phialemonium atrogriseum]KAK1765495.1 ribonuclease H2 subunit A [Phialemonium atrogriseum]